MPEDGPSLEDLLARIDALTDELVQTKITFSETASTFRDKLEDSESKLAHAEEEILRLRRMLELATGVKAPTTEEKRKRRWGVGGPLAVAGAAAVWPARKAIEHPHLPTVALLGSGAYLMWILIGPPPILEVEKPVVPPPAVSQPHIPQPPGIGVPKRETPSTPQAERQQPAGNRTRTPGQSTPEPPGSAPGEEAMTLASVNRTVAEPRNEPAGAPPSGSEPTPPDTRQPSGNEPPSGGQPPQDTEPPQDDTNPPTDTEPPGDTTPPPDNEPPDTDISGNERCLVNLDVADLAHAKLLCR